MKDEIKSGDRGNEGPGDHSGPGGGDHGHDDKVTIIVNTREKVWKEKEISFAELLSLAFNPVPVGDNWSFTVAYRKGLGHKPDGTLIAGEFVKVKDGMIFNVTATDKS